MCTYMHKYLSHTCKGAPMNVYTYNLIATGIHRHTKHTCTQKY